MVGPVPPSELAAKRVVRDRFYQATWRDRSEMEVHGKVARPVQVETISIGCIGGRAARREQPGAIQRVGLAADHDLGKGRARKRRGHPDPTGRVDRRTDLCTHPASMECREHAALADRIGLHDEEARVKDERDGPAHGFIAPYRVRRDVAGGVDPPRAHFAHDRGQDLFRSAVSDDQAAADASESIVQVDKRGVEPSRASRSATGGSAQARITHEQWHDLVVVRERGHKRRVVIETQVPAEPGDRRHGAERFRLVFMVCIA